MDLAFEKLEIAPEALGFVLQPSFRRPAGRRIPSRPNQARLQLAIEPLQPFVQEPDRAVVGGFRTGIRDLLRDLGTDGSGRDVKKNHGQASQKEA